MRMTFSTCGMASTDSRHGSDVADADDADDDALFAFDGVHFVAELFHDAANLVDLLTRWHGASWK